MDRLPGRLEDGARLLRRLRPQARRPLRLPAALRALPARPRRLAPALAGRQPRPRSSCSASASRTSSSTAPKSASRCRSSTRCCSTCWARALWIGFRGRGEGLRPVWPVAWLLVAALFLMGFRVGLNVADSGAIDVGYASVVGADRVAHGEPIYDNFPEDVSAGRHLRPGQLLRLRPLRADLALVGKLGRPAGRPRRRGLLRPRHLRLPDPARDPHPPGPGRPPPRRDPRLRLGRLPLHRLHPGVELQRRPGRDAARRDPAGAGQTPGPRRDGGAGDLRQVRPRAACADAADLRAAEATDEERARPQVFVRVGTPHRMARALAFFASFLTVSVP